MADPLLEVRDLRVAFRDDHRRRTEVVAGDRGSASFCGAQ